MDNALRRPLENTELAKKELHLIWSYSREGICHFKIN